MIGQNRTLDILEKAIAQCEADQADCVLINFEQSLSRFANNFIHQNVNQNNTKLFVRVVRNGRIGVATTNRLDAQALKSTCRRAIKIADVSPKKVGFKSLPRPKAIPRIKTYFDATAGFNAQMRAEVIKKFCDRAKEHGMTASGSTAIYEGEIAVANSLGIRAYQPLTLASVALIMGYTQNESGYASGISRNVEDIDFDAILDVAAEKCKLAKNPKPLKAGKYRVILEPEAFANLLEWLNYIGFGAKGLMEKTSFLTDRIGKKIFHRSITIYDDGRDTSGVAIPFDFEGVPKKKVVFVEDGVAKGVVYDSYYGGLFKRKSTGHALTPDETYGPLPFNVFVAAGNKSLDEMIETCDRGILITRFHYINGYLDTRNALLTGMTRDGTYLVEDGKIKHALKNLRFTQNMLKALSKVEMLGSKQKTIASWWEEVGATRCPAMRLREFNFTGSTG